MSYHHAIGAIEDTGLSPYKVEGNPVIALIAQINRFVGKTVKGPGCPSGARPTYPYDAPLGTKDSKPFMLQPALTEDAASAALQIATARYACAPFTLQSTGAMDKRKWLVDGSRYNTWSFVMANIAEFTDSNLPMSGSRKWTRRSCRQECHSRRSPC
jgi:hypothetical protein